MDNKLCEGVGQRCPGCSTWITNPRKKGVFVASVIDGGGFPRKRWFCNELCIQTFAHKRIKNFEKTFIKILKRGEEVIEASDEELNEWMQEQ